MNLNKKLINGLTHCTSLEVEEDDKSNEEIQPEVSETEIYSQASNCNRQSNRSGRPIRIPEHLNDYILYNAKEVCLTNSKPGTM